MQITLHSTNINTDCGYATAVFFHPDNDPGFILIEGREYKTSSRKWTIETPDGCRLDQKTWTLVLPDGTQASAEDAMGWAWDGVGGFKIRTSS